MFGVMQKRVNLYLILQEHWRAQVQESVFQPLSQETSYGDQGMLEFISVVENISMPHILETLLRFLQELAVSHMLLDHKITLY